MVVGYMACWDHTVYPVSKKVLGNPHSTFWGNAKEIVKEENGTQI